MGMMAIWVMWPEPFEQTFVPPSKGGSIWNLASFDPVVLEETMFENVYIHTYIHKHLHTDDGGLPILSADQWAFGSGELNIVESDVKPEQTTTTKRFKAS